MTQQSYKHDTFLYWKTDNWEIDPDYVNNEIAGYALYGLKVLSNTYKFTFFCLDVFTDDEQ